MRKYLYLQTIFLVCGAIFAWSNVFRQMANFTGRYGTIFRFKDCAIPNPILTACFFGSVAFLAALSWAVKNFYTPTYKSQKYLRNFLVFCVLFALSVLFLEAAEYYKWFTVGSSSIPFSCTPGVHPLKTPCFVGMLFFLFSYFSSRLALKNIPKLA